MKKDTRGYVFYLLIIAILVTVSFILIQDAKPEKKIYSDVVQMIENKELQSCVLENNTLTVKKKGSSEAIVVKIAYPDQFFHDFNEKLLDQVMHNELEYDVIVDNNGSFWTDILPYILAVLLCGALVFFLLRQNGGGKQAMNFGKMKARLPVAKDKKTFADVAGADEEKEELVEIVEFLKSPQKYIEIGARVPKGILLVGPPGTGKTLLAKAVAGEAGVPFLSISGSDFVELYVGVGASRVRDLFDQAKKLCPAIIFIDEIDAVGRKRGAGLGGGHDEREQTLNQLLVEMDGFAKNEGIIIIAATNRADILDPALLRPGRFDRHVNVGHPDIKGREKILEVHAKDKHFEDDVRLLDVAKTTAGFTGADLENLLNEAALLSVRGGRKKINNSDLHEALMKIMAGPEKRSRIISDKERQLTAYHEAGHAVAMQCLSTQDPVHQVSIIQRGSIGGYTMHLPTEDKYYSSKTEMFEDIISLLGGRVAESLCLDDISTGASNDIMRASEIARKMVTKYGMSDVIGPIVYSSESDEVFLGRDFTASKHFSEATAALIDQEIKSVVDRAYNRCRDLLEEHLPQLKTIAESLLSLEKIDGDTFLKLFEGTDESHEA